MSRMNFFCQGASTNGLPWPVPLGTVKAWMNAMTALARCLPAGVRLTACEEARKLALLVLAVWPGGNPGAGGGCKSEFIGIANHVVGGSARDADERIGDGLASSAFDDEAAHQMVVRRHASERFLSGTPAAIGLAVGCERRDVDHREQTEPIKLGRDRPPFVARVAGQVRRRPRDRWRTRRLGLARGQRPLARVAAQDAQVRRSGWRAAHLVSF